MKNLEKLKNPFWFKLYLFSNLRAAFFASISLLSLSGSKSQVLLPYKKMNLNPFKTTYFASMCMASELSTGVLVMQEIAKSGYKISMFVLDMNAKFIKRGLKDIVFTCDDTDKALIKNAIAQTIATGEDVVISLSSHGVDIDGVLISEFTYFWTIKLKKS
ncbi:MAG: DUF4442 domain-containing protein [Chitinophagales bacterium]|jgi:hypothetical protein|nr:DUF4442 domain-containing protein [Chitinophagales bacterium]